MALQPLSFDQDKDAIIARLILQRIQAFIVSGYSDDLFSKNEAEAVIDYAIESDKVRYSVAMNHINSHHHPAGQPTTAVDPLALTVQADTPCVTCDAVAVSCD